MALTNKDLIKSRLNSFNIEYYKCLTRELCALWTIDSEYGLGTADLSQGSFPIWPRIDIQPRRSNAESPIRETALKALSRILSTDPIPEFSGISDIEAEVRQKFWLARAQGTTDAEGDWFTEIREAWVDGDCLGAGLVLFGLITDVMSGEQKVALRYVPVRQVIWDATAINPRRSRWVATCDYLDYQDAVDEFGEEHVKPHLSKLPTSSSGNNDPEIVPVWRYFDIGSKKSDPTYAVIIGEISNNPFKVQKNPYGPILPVAWMVGDIAPGYQRPIGRVAKMLPGQMSLNNQLEKLHRISMTNPGFTVVQSELFDAKQLELVRNGVPNVVLEATKQIDGTPALRVPGAEASQTDLLLLQEHRNEIARQGELSDLDRGSPLPSTRSATEVGYIQSGVEQTQSSEILRTLDFLKETMTKFFYIAALYDRSPVSLNIRGYNVPINDYRDPASSIDKFLKQPGEMVMTHDALTGQDARVRRAERQMQLEKLAPLAASGKIDARTWVEEYLKSLGERDIQRWLPKPELTPGGLPSPDVMDQGQVPLMNQSKQIQGMSYPQEMIGRMIA